MTAETLARFPREASFRMGSESRRLATRGSAPPPRQEDGNPSGTRAGHSQTSFRTKPGKQMTLETRCQETHRFRPFHLVSGRSHKTALYFVIHRVLPYALSHSSKTRAPASRTRHIHQRDISCDRHARRREVCRRRARRSCSHRHNPGRYMPFELYFSRKSRPVRDP